MLRGKIIRAREAQILRRADQPDLRKRRSYRVCRTVRGGVIPNNTLKLSQLRVFIQRFNRPKRQFPRVVADDHDTQGRPAINRRQLQHPVARNTTPTVALSMRKSSDSDRALK